MKFWNENDNIREVLLSLKNQVTRIYALDGAFSYFPYKHSKIYNKPQSTDGSLESITGLMSEMPEIELISQPHPWPTQIDKMNYGIQQCHAQEEDYIFFMDGHEVMKGDFQKQQRIIEVKEWPIGKVIVYNPKTYPSDYDFTNFHRKVNGQWRILRWHPDLKLIKKHWNFNIINTGELDKHIPKNHETCKHIRLVHMPKNPERDRLRDLYKKAIGPTFHFDERAYVEWRQANNIEDGRLS